MRSCVCDGMPSIKKAVQWCYIFHFNKPMRSTSHSASLLAPAFWIPHAMDTMLTDHMARRPEAGRNAKELNANELHANNKC